MRKLLSLKLHPNAEPVAYDPDDFRKTLDRCVLAIRSSNFLIPNKTMETIWAATAAFIKNLIVESEAVLKSSTSLKTDVFPNKDKLSQVLASIVLDQYLKERSETTTPEEWEAILLPLIGKACNGSLPTVAKFMSMVIYPSTVDEIKGKAADKGSLLNAEPRIKKALGDYLATEQAPPEVVRYDTAMYWTAIIMIAALALIAFTAMDRPYVGLGVAAAIILTGIANQKIQKSAEFTIRVKDIAIHLDRKDINLALPLRRELDAANFQHREGEDKYNTFVEVLVKLAGKIPPGIYRISDGERSFYLVTSSNTAFEILRDHHLDLSHGKILPRLHQLMFQNLNGQEGLDSPYRKAKRGELMALTRAVLPFQYEELYPIIDAEFGAPTDKATGLFEFGERLTRMGALRVVMGFENPRGLLEPFEEWMNGFTHWFWQNPKSDNPVEASPYAKQLEDMGHQFLLFRKDQIKREMELGVAEAPKIGIHNSWLWRLLEYFAQKRCNVVITESTSFIKALLSVYTTLPTRDEEKRMGYDSDKLYEGIRQIIHTVNPDEADTLLEIFRDIIKEWASMTVLGHETTAIMYSRLVKAFVEHPEDGERVIAEYQKGLHLAIEQKGHRTVEEATRNFHRQHFLLTTKTTGTHLSRIVLEVLYDRSPVTQLAICARNDFEAGGRVITNGSEVIMPTSLLQEQSITQNHGEHPPGWDPGFWEGKALKDEDFLTFGFLGGGTDEPRSCPGRFLGLSESAQYAVQTLKKLRESNLEIKLTGTGHGALYPFNKPSDEFILVKK